MNIEGWISLQDSDFISFGYKPGSGVARSYGQFNSVPQSCLTLCDPMDCSMPGFPVHHQLPELAQTHVTGHGTTWFQIREGVNQGCILSPCLFNLKAEYIMQNARLDESQAGIKIARRKYQQPQIWRWHHPNGRKQRGTNETFDEGERGEWKIWLKTQHSKR